MESLNLNNLASSLPPSNLIKAEKDLTDNFKAAALSLTTLYRSSKRTSKRAYNAGYAAACQDLLLMIQQGVSANDSSDGQGMTIGRIMDYVEARLEAIRSREEEEDEDEEKDRERERSKPGASTTTPAKPAPPVAAAKPAAPAPTPSAALYKTKDATANAPPTPYTPSTLSANTIATSTPSPLQRAAKSRLYALATGKDPALFTTAPAPFAFDAPATTDLSPPAGTLDFAPYAPSEVSLGSKRRHNVMLFDSSPPPTPTESGPSTRRRTRSARGAALAAHAHQHGFHVQDQTSGTDAMDVEEEGRERKRVSRR